MRQISRENYLLALDIVERYHSQIIHGHDLVNIRLLNAAGTCLIKDFLIEHSFSTRIINSVERFINAEIEGDITFKECTVEFFLEKHFYIISNYANKYPREKPKISKMRGISNSNMNRILDVMHDNGFRIYVDPYRKLMNQFDERNATG